MIALTYALPSQAGADKGYDSQACLRTLCARGITPHVAQNTTGRRSAIDGRTSGWAGYAVSVRIPRHIEEIFGWMKTVGGFRKTRYRCPDPIDFASYLVAIDRTTWCGWPDWPQ